MSIVERDEPLDDERDDVVGPVAEVDPQLRVGTEGGVEAGDADVPLVVGGDDEVAAVQWHAPVRRVGEEVDTAAERPAPGLQIPLPALLH